MLLLSWVNGGVAWEMGSLAKEGDYAARVIRDPAKVECRRARVTNDLSRVRCALSSARTKTTEAARGVARATRDVTGSISNS